MNTLSKTRDLVLAAVIAAIIVIMAFVPFLGYIPLGFMNATTVHIPVIIGAIILGPKYGAFLGLTFGLTSLWKNTFMPNPTSFVFSPFVTMGQFHGNLGSLVICLVPRILIGVVAYYVYRLFMNLIYFLFGDQYASAASWTAKWVYGVILGIIGMQGVPEALVAGIIVTAVAGILLKLTPDIRG